MDCKVKIVLINFLLIFVLINVVKCSEAVKITCERIETYNWPPVGSLLTCYTGSDTRILTSNVLLNNGNKEYSIEGIKFQTSSKVNCIPQGLKKSYPNLKALFYVNQPLKTLSEDDLKQFGNDLLRFGVYYGKITFLARNLFRYTPNLKYINFHGNPLKLIEQGFFENISKMDQLEYVSLSSCSCIDEIKETSKIQNGFWTHNCNDRSAMPQRR